MQSRDWFAVNLPTYASFAVQVSTFTNAVRELFLRNSVDVYFFKISF